MEQFGILEVANNLEEFSVSKIKQENARNNLLIDDMALQNADDVTIEGHSKIYTDEFKFIPSSGVNIGRYLTALDQKGTVSYGNFTLPEWVSDYKQSEIGIGVFSNDIGFVELASLQNNKFIFDEDLVNLANRPTFEEIKKQLGHTGTFSSAVSNLKSHQPLYSRQNLGIGNIATFGSNVVTVANINITSNLQIESIERDQTKYRTFLSNQAGGGPVVGIGVDLHLKTDVLLSNSSALPSSVLLSNIINDSYNSMSVNSFSNKEYILSNEESIKTILKSDILYTADNFDVSVTDDSIVRSNLGIGDISTQNVENVNLDKLNVSNLQLSGSENDQMNKVYFDSTWVEHSNFIKSNLASADIAGFVAGDQLLNYDLALMVNADLNSNIDVLQSNTQFDLAFYSSNLFQISSNLAELANISRARSNLKLNPVATSGSLEHISGKPTYLSELVNDANYLKRNQNLADIHPTDRRKALSNIGVSDMAFEDANNIGGTATLPLGVGNRKFHSTDCKIDYVYVDKGNFFLRDLDHIGEIEQDFLVTEKYDVETPGVINYKYRFKQIPKADEVYFRGAYQLNSNDYVRVVLNDLDNLTTRFETDLIQGFRDDIEQDYIFGDHHVPTCKFSYHKFSSMILSILDRFDIPIEFYEGGTSNL